MHKIDVIISDNMWDADSEGAILFWCYANGDYVEEGTMIAEVTDEKVVTELHAPASGILTILVPANTTIEEGQVVARIEPVPH